MTRPLAWFLAAVVSAPLAAQRYKPTEKAWAKLERATLECAKRQHAALAAFQKTPESDEKTRAKWLAEHKAAQRALDFAQATFRAAFDKSNWNAWKLPADAKLLEHGLETVARAALARDPLRARKAWERMLDKLPKCAASLHARTAGLPQSWLATDPRKGFMRIAKLMKDVAPAQRHGMWSYMSDCEAVQGKTAEARALLEGVIQDIPQGTGDGYDPVRRARLQAELRLALLTKEATALGDGEWLGGERRSLDDLAGKVVLLDFFATWCGPCRSALGELDALQKRHGKQGLVVLGVTEPYPNGFLPESRKHPHRGKGIDGMNREAWRVHLAAFREVMRPSYPFVIAGHKQLTDYKVTLIPTLVVIDKWGVIRFVTTGDGQGPVLQRIVQRLLKERKKS